MRRLIRTRLLIGSLHRTLAVLLVILCGCFSAFGQAIDRAALCAGLQSGRAIFPSLILPEDGGTVSSVFVLGDQVVTVQDKHVFDAVKVTAPASMDGLDFVWCFNAPISWGNWYIIPAEGEAEGGFRNWLPSDKIYKDLDVPGEQGRIRVQQTLDGSYFKPGKEYILWFRQTEGDAQGEIRLRARFAPKQTDWDHEGIEKALGLIPLGPKEQVENLKSRGGAILLDPAFFEPRFAANRIDDVFLNLRQTRRMSGGFFVTMEIACPPCLTEPSYAEIRRKYGEADFVETVEQKRLLAERAESEGASSEEADCITYYYDHFGFEVAPGDEAEKVLRVRTQAADYSTLRGKADRDSFGRIDIKNLTVFYSGNREVGRMYYFMEDDKLPLVIVEPPPGTYTRDDAVLEYLGKGDWVRQDRYEGGDLARKIPFVGHRMEGVAEGYYGDGTVRFRASYKQGNLHGEAIKFTESGQVESKRRFVEGKEAEAVKDP